MPEHPESFPVNALVPIPGTPLEGNEFVNHHTMLRTISTARIAMPSTIIRLSAGRHKFSEAEQAMCFMAGANAVFTGENMLTTPCTFSQQCASLVTLIFSHLQALLGMK